MKLFRCAFCVLFIALCHVRAQDDVDEKVDDFKPTSDDDMILYTQKFAVKLGFRSMSGVKSSFSGKGLITDSAQAIDVATGAVVRTYHDGHVGLDTRTVVDPSGASVPITPDGKTNIWGYTADSQAAINGLIMMHSYSADVTEAPHNQNPSSGYGVEISSEREMGKLFGTRVKWGLIAGMSVNGLSEKSSGTVSANITKVTDYYSLFGQAAPGTTYTAPRSSGGVDTSVLLSNEPLVRDPTTTTSNTAVTNSSKLHGAYMTFRAGPTLFIPITQKFSGAFSAGLVLVYAGSTYQLTQSFQPETGTEIIQTLRDGTSDLLPGFYADANLQYTMNETSGLYVGAVYQSSGHYTQTISDSTGVSNYSTRVDLSSLQGFRAGVSFKF